VTGKCNLKEFKRKWTMPNRDTFLALLGGTVENNKNFGGNSKGHTSLQRQRFENLLTEQITCKLLCNGA